MASRVYLILALSAFLQVGCNDNNGSSTKSDSTFIARYEVLSTVENRDFAPYPNDIWFIDTASADATLNIPIPSDQAINNSGRNLSFVNTLDGFSTTASIQIPFNDEPDLNTAEPMNPLEPSSTANIIVLDADTGTVLIPGVEYELEVSRITETGEALLNILPLMPLKPKNTYMFYLLSGITNISGTPVRPDDDFQKIKDAWSSKTTTGDDYLDILASEAVGPVLDEGVNLLGLAPENIIAAWSLSTQSISDVIEAVALQAEAQTTDLIRTGLTTSDVDETLSGVADIIVGTTETPYYQSKLNPYGSIWLTTQGTQPNRYDPTPAPTETLTIPLLVTQPNADSGMTKPDEGWPVVIFMHGISENRTSAIAVADSMAMAGFVVVAIDHTLHGVTDPNNLFFQGPGNPSTFNIFGDNERHFFLDAYNNTTGIDSPDGIFDNGIQLPGYMVLNPLSGRDTLRQTSADLIHLALTIPTMDLDGDQLPDLDGTRIHYFGLSWSALQGPLFLGIDNHITTATLSSPGGTWSDLLTDPESLSFGKPLLEHLANLGIVYGSKEFDLWIRDWQNVLDPVDSLNFAAATVEMHPLHIIEILGDTVIPNAATENFALLSGADSISATTIAAPGEVLNTIVRFTLGNHSSAIYPNDSPEVTAEMQSQAAAFAASGGTIVPINSACDCILQ
ncbi:MAG: hypothetical protein PVI97_17885 [Candidatus Thiodiazotropha sp.]